MAASFINNKKNPHSSLQNQKSKLSRRITESQQSFSGEPVKTSNRMRQNKRGGTSRVGSGSCQESAADSIPTFSLEQHLGDLSSTAQQHTEIWDLL